MGVSEVRYSRFIKSNLNLSTAIEMRSGYLILIFSAFLFSCSTYYQINSEFNTRFEQGDLESAEKFLKNNKTKKTKFLYYANRGVVNSLKGDYEASNHWLERAYLYHQDYQKNYFDEAASFMVNPNVVAYKAEDHEQLLLLYYKALNYLRLKNYEAALVECRRLNDQLQVLSDKYKSENKYKRDAFVHNLMGIIYEASGDVNNAFIAYRNAYEIYQDDYQRLFGVTAPDQLKQDLLRTAHRMGFYDEVSRFEQQFETTYKPSANPDGELVFFWHNGLGPIKGEWSINFAVEKGGDGFVTFANSEQGMSFPFVFSSGDGTSGGDLSDINMLRIAFPKYEERGLIFESGTLITTDGSFELQPAEDVNKIAFKTLEERMLRELAKGLLRAALKEAAEKQLSQENEGFGAVLGLVNALTEKADTRNWQTLPHTIHYARVPLKTGENEVGLTLFDTDRGQSVKQNFTYTISKGETVFQVYQSLEAQPVR